MCLEAAAHTPNLVNAARCDGFLARPSPGNVLSDDLLDTIKIRFYNFLLNYKNLFKIAKTLQ